MGHIDHPSEPVDLPLGGVSAGLRRNANEVRLLLQTHLVRWTLREGYFVLDERLAPTP